MEKAIGAMFKRENWKECDWCVEMEERLSFGTEDIPLLFRWLNSTVRLIQKGTRTHISGGGRYYSVYASIWAYVHIENLMCVHNDK